MNDASVIVAESASQPNPVETLYSQVTNRSSDTTVVVFTGLAKQVGGLPPFEFVRSMDSLGVNSIILRDPNSSWYQTDVPGFGRTFGDKVNSIIQMVEDLGGSSVHVLGTSAGGYAALYFATLYEVDSLLTFGGQASILESRRTSFGDKRWPRLISKAQEASPERFLDIALAGPLQVKGIAMGLTGSKFKIDLVHSLYAARMLGRDYTPCSVSGAGHAVAPQLKAEGKLYPLLEAAFTGRGLSPHFLNQLNASGRHTFSLL